MNSIETAARQSGLSEVPCSAPRALTADDVVAAENKGYDHGLRHGREEAAETIEGLRRTLRTVLASAHPHPMENGAMYHAWEVAKRVLDEPNGSDEGRRDEA